MQQRTESITGGSPQKEKLSGPQLRPAIWAKKERISPL